MALISRRSMLRGSAAVGFASATGLLGAMTASAADTSGYKALVCVFLKGGLDGADLVLPTDAASHDAMAVHRADMFRAYGVGSGDSSRDRANLLALASARNFGGRGFGLARDMGPLHDLYRTGKMAVVGNVGPLVMPTTRDTMESGAAELPARLFSHNDQQSQWMSMGLEGARLGWGGEFADRVAPASGTGRTFTSITASAPDTFLTGARTRQYPARRSGSVNLTLLDRWRLGRNNDAARAALSAHFASTGHSSDNLLRRDLAAGNARTQSDNATFDSAVEDAVELQTVFPDTGLGKQLATVAKVIAVRGVLGASRQVFYADTGGFDTHDNQHNQMPRLQSQIADAVRAFNDAMVELGVDDQVTLFTASDFGRTLVVNGSGTDHGWGSHHLVVGGAVRGGELYGDFPSMDLGGQQYTATRGRMIPQVAVDQYAASLGRWFGLSGAELRDALPNLGNFSTVPDLFGLGATV